MRCAEGPLENDESSSYLVSKRRVNKTFYSLMEIELYTIQIFLQSLSVTFEVTEHVKFDLKFQDSSFLEFVKKKKLLKKRELILEIAQRRSCFSRNGFKMILWLQRHLRTILFFFYSNAALSWNTWHSMPLTCPSELERTKDIRLLVRISFTHCALRHSTFFWSELTTVFILFSENSGKLVFLLYFSRGSWKHKYIESEKRGWERKKS